MTTARRTMTTLLAGALLWTAACGGHPAATPATSTGSGGSTTNGAGPTSAAGASGLRWIIAGSTLTRLRAADTAGTTTARYFDTPNAYVITGAADWAIPDGWTSTPTASFTSYTKLRTALNRGTLDPRIKAVLYDDEQWSLTPRVEQNDPAHYYQLAAALVHQHHLLFIAAPATNLVNVLNPSTAAGQGHYQAFLNLNLASDVARDADVVDIQAQGSEMSVGTFGSFVDAAAAQARAANPSAKVLAGISTNPSGTAVTAAAIDRAIGAVRANVDGFWLNDPAAGTACPRCAGPFPEVALTAVRGLG
jgi:hypothetical protein